MSSSAIEVAGAFTLRNTLAREVTHFKHPNMQLELYPQPIQHHDSVQFDTLNICFTDMKSLRMSRSYGAFSMGLLSRFIELSFASRNHTLSRGESLRRP